MKILSIMCDMVRPNILNFDNCCAGSFEYYLKKLGGTLYTNCFTQGPDTGRSLGCFWSGCVPQDNGCDERVKYPKFYLKKSSFLDNLKNHEFSFYFFSNPNEKILGVFPPGYESVGVHNEDLDLKKFVKQIDFDKDNIYTHITLTDFHWALDDFGACGRGVEQGLRILKDSINSIFEIASVDLFDYIFIFSDHGFKYNFEYTKEEKYYLLNRDRVNTLMYIIKKGERDFSYNDKLCSLIDFYPTICNIIGDKTSVKGYSFFSKDEPDFIFSEDHGDFSPRIYQPIEYWALIKKDVIYLRSMSGYYRDDKKIFDLEKKEFDKILCKNSISFAEVYKKLNILTLYNVMANDKSYYSNGEKRYIIGKLDLIERFKRKINLNKKRK